MPVPPKPADRRIGHTTRSVGLVSGDNRPQTAPEAPAGLLKATADEWVAFWASPAASLTLDADRPALGRLFTLRDERRRCLAAARKGRVVEGSTGQPALHPLYKQVTVLDAEIRQLEDRFGLTPLARLRLGATFAEARRSLAELNAESAEEDGDLDRFRVIDVEANDAG